MANDVSYFKVSGDSTTYQFNDPDAENRIGALESTVNDQAGDIADNTTAINANASAIGTLSNLTTSAKGSLVAAINEVDSHADTNASAISQLISKTKLSLTRVSQSWVSADDFARLAACRRGNMLHFRGNLCVTYGSGFNGDFQIIGTISGWNAAYDTYANVPMQSDGSKVLAVQITCDGSIKIYSSTAFNGTPFFRFNICVPCS